jgi:hypothetical protein
MASSLDLAAQDLELGGHGVGASAGVGNFLL